jgi:UDPglucose 6-dehydrogenase
MVVGGKNTTEIVNIFIRRMGPHTRFLQTDSRTAEVIKYMENIFGAMKVTFCNEMYECCKALGVDYNIVREGWLMDPRVAPFYSAVFSDARGWKSHCWDKDPIAFIREVEKHGYAPELLKEMLKTNAKIRTESGLPVVNFLKDTE